LRLKVFFHDRCFDGTASAALFGRFYRDVIARDVHTEPVGMRHCDGDPFQGIRFDADDHACVDFRFCPDPAMRWWFDHHRTAFQPPSLREVYERRRLPTQIFDPDAPSCTGLIARVLAAQWGWSPPPALAETVRWADIIDAASFGSAEEASSLATPAQRLAVFLGATDSDQAVARYIRALEDGAALGELDTASWVRGVLDPLLDVRARLRAHLREIARVVRPVDGGDGGDVVVIDLLDQGELPSPGFLGYAEFPHCRYAVAVNRGHGAIKIAVGYNPWCGLPRAHDIGALCQPLGGGGHAAVGGVTLEPHETARARAAIDALLAALIRTPTS